MEYPTHDFPDLEGLAGAGQSTHLGRLLESSYRVPDQFDFGRVQTYINAKRGELEDHLWLLREDPAYFVATINEANHHNRFTMQAEHQEKSSTTRAKAHWDYIIGFLVLTWYRDVMWWEIVWRALGDVEVSKQCHERDSSPNQRFSKEYRSALSALTFQCDQMIGMTIADLKDAMLGCSSFRDYQSINRSSGSDSMEVRVALKPDDRLWSLLLKLHSQEAYNVIGLPSLLYEIERLIAMNKKEKNRLSPRLAGLISDFGILAEIQRQLALSSPGGRVTAAMSPSELKTYGRNIIEPSVDLLAKVRDIPDLGSFGTNQTAFAYPVDKKRTALTTAQLRRAEVKLDEFWNVIDNHFIKETGKPLHGHMENVIELRALARTPEWSEDDQSQERGQDALAASFWLSTLEERTERTVTREELSPQREKVKTRAAVSTDPQVYEERQQDSPPITTSDDDRVMEDTKFSKKDHRVLAMLFPLPRQEDIAGELPWANFLHTMTSLGFGVQKLDGSASLFSPVNEKLTRSIIFHEPHPEKSIPFNVARRYGRRLTRAYGWTAESFIRY